MYTTIETLSEQQLSGLTVIDFGTNWCGYCQAAQPLTDTAFRGYSGIRHIKVEDGKGKRLGRLHSVKLWPTLIFMKDGVEIQRLVRPDNSGEIREALSVLQKSV